jgi:hypothetical protein
MTSGISVSQFIKNKETWGWFNLIVFQLCHSGIMAISCGGLVVVCFNGVAIVVGYWWFSYGGL